MITKVSSIFHSRLLICGFSTHTVHPYKGKSYDEVKADRKSIFPLYSHHYYKEPFFPVQGFKEYLYDTAGRQYVDLIGGISCMNLGHSHPRLTEIYQKEAPKLLTLSSKYTNQYQGLYAQKLCAELGNGIDTVFFFNSGSESNDFAYNMAKAYTQSNTVVSLRNGYHGTAGNSYHLTNIGTWQTPLPRAVDLEKLAWPNLYRSAHQTVDSLIKDAEEQLDANTNGKVAGMWMEPIMGAGGINPIPKEYAHKIHKVIKRMGGLFVADEVQAGFGRIGKHTWGFKWLDIKPDVVIMAKAIANGHPFSAVATRREIAESIRHTHFPPYAGSPLECRLAIEVLDIMKDEKIPEHS